MGIIYLTSIIEKQNNKIIMALFGNAIFGHFDYSLTILNGRNDQIDEIGKMSI